MRIAKINQDISIEDQMKKVREEDDEFLQEAQKLNVNIQKLVGEYFDKIQSSANLLLRMGVTKEVLDTHLKLHYQKLEIREFEGKIKIDGWQEL